jgi:hypothetical protein
MSSKENFRKCYFCNVVGTFKVIKIHEIKIHKCKKKNYCKYCYKILDTNLNHICMIYL